MKIGNIIVVLIAGIIGGAFVGWAVAALVGQGNHGQSTATGVGSLVGLLTSGIIVLVNRKPQP